VGDLVQERDLVARRNRHAMALLGATRDFPAVQSTDRLAQALFANVLALTSANRAALVRWYADEGRGSVEFLSVGHPLGERTAVTDRSYVGGACAGGRPLVWEDAGSLDEARRVYGDGEARRHIGALGVIPYFIAGEVRGALVVEGDQPGDVRAEDRRALRQLVDLAGASIERLTRTEEEALRATTDKLTGLKNRRYFDEQFARESARVFRTGSSLAVVLADVDFFKRINDGHGHDAGDAVLRGIAARFGQAMRDVDVAARFGGEEFVVLLPDTDLDGALVMAERLRRSIELRPFTAGAIDIAATMSFGVAAFPRSSPTREGILAAADRALYRAKAEGRNCVRSAPPRDSQTKA
jgi:diguanylate cyclase (GGDEF)-like protein